MKNHATGISLLAVFYLVGCASAPKILPRNEINEPVFHQTDFFALGAGIARTWTQREGGDSYREGGYVLPMFNYQNKVSDWASYTLLPVFWNLRLTGEQYSDSEQLKQRKLHIAFHGGINNLGYSSRDGLVSGGLVSLEGKYLFNRYVFLGAVLKSGLDNLENRSSRIDGFSAGFGAQVSERNSLKWTYSLQRFILPRNTAYDIGGIYHLDGDTRTKVDLRHTYYAWRKHVLGSEIGFAYRNYSVSSTRQFALGVHYAYMFD